METLNQSHKVHVGRKISRIREIRGIKQETLAQELGITQQQVSRLEQSETIEDQILEKIAKVMGVTSEAIKNFSEEAVLNKINTFYDQSSLTDNSSFHYNCTFNPLDKVVELYERLLASEKEKVEILQNKS